MSQFSRVQNAVQDLITRRQQLDILRRSLIGDEEPDLMPGQLAVLDDSKRPWHFCIFSEQDVRPIIQTLDNLIQSINRQLEDIDSQLKHVAPETPEQEDPDEC